MSSLSLLLSLFRSRELRLHISPTMWEATRDEHAQRSVAVAARAVVSLDEVVLLVVLHKILAVGPIILRPAAAWGG
jgi:hypothetical protein